MKIPEGQKHTADYERNGVVTVRGLLSDDEVQSLRDGLSDYVKRHLRSLPSEDFVLEADGASVRNLWRLDTHSDFFRSFSRQSDLIELVRPLVRGDPLVMGAESFNKPARVGSTVPPHQDNAYFCLKPPDALTLWIALDAVTEENGPVRYLPGSHRQGLRPHTPSGVEGNSMGLIDDVSGEETYTGLLAPGDALIHHCEIIHSSSPNTSGRNRCGFLIVYRGEHCVQGPALRSAYVMAR